MKRLMSPLLVLYGLSMTFVAGYQAHTQWSLYHLIQQAAATDDETAAESWMVLNPVRSSADPPLLRESVHAVRAAKILAAFGAIPLPSGRKIVKVESPAPVWTRVVLDNGQYFVYDFVGFTPPGRLPQLAFTPLTLSLKDGKKPVSQLMSIGYALAKGPKGPKEPERLYCSFRYHERPLLVLRSVHSPSYKYGIHSDSVIAEWVDTSEFPPPSLLAVNTSAER